MLLSHLDVVAVQADKWTHAPFGGEVSDGYLWGRGAIDCKGLAAIQLLALLLLVRQRISLDRDIIFAATADEERGGKDGLTWLVDNRSDLLDAQWCITEGGGEPYAIGGRTMYTYITAEKGFVAIRVIARGPGGHGSIPQDDNPVLRLTQAMHLLGTARLPLHRTATMDRFLDGLAAILGGGHTQETLIALADDCSALRCTLKDGFLADTIYAMLHNTLTPTLLRGSEGVTAIPTEAEGWVDGRFVPGQTLDSFYSEVQAVLADLPVELAFVRSEPALESPADSDLLETLTGVMAEQAPDAVLVPSVFTGGTDAKRLQPLGVRTYGFFPMAADGTVKAWKLAHNHNERIAVKSLVFGTKVLYDVIRRFCSLD
jgi:acetylornithine deacetylase/succinyl-diaminopimelate desuccinylase-like protein